MMEENFDKQSNLLEVEISQGENCKLQSPTGMAIAMEN